MIQKSHSSPSQRGEISLYNIFFSPILTSQTSFYMLL